MAIEATIDESDSTQQANSDWHPPSVMDDRLYQKQNKHEQLKTLMDRKAYFREQITFFEKQSESNQAAIVELLHGA